MSSTIAMHIRNAATEDVAEIVTLRKEVAEYHAALNKQFELSADAIELFTSDLKNNLADKRFRVLVAVNENKILGYAIGKIKVSPPVFVERKFGFIDEFGVTAHARKHGVGKALVNGLLEWFKENGAADIELGVLLQNTAGVNFWRSCGFEDAQLRMYKKL